jgi:hypothetical protein
MVDELGGNDGQREKSKITMRARKKERRKMEKGKGGKEEDSGKVRKKETLRQTVMD